MKYHIWHLLVAMTFVATWLPLSRWLLALEALDHPSKPQTTADFIGFYLGSITLVGLPMALIVVYLKNRSQKLTSSAGNRRNDA